MFGRVREVRVHCGRGGVRVLCAKAEYVRVEYCLKRRRMGCGFDMVFVLRGCACSWRCAWWRAHDI